MIKKIYNIKFKFNKIKLKFMSISKNKKDEMKLQTD